MYESDFSLVAESINCAEIVPALLEEIEIFPTTNGLMLIVNYNDDDGDFSLGGIESIADITLALTFLSQFEDSDATEVITTTASRLAQLIEEGV